MIAISFSLTTLLEFKKKDSGNEVGKVQSCFIRNDCATTKKNEEARSTNRIYVPRCYRQVAHLYLYAPVSIPVLLVCGNSKETKVSQSITCEAAAL